VKRATERRLAPDVIRGLALACIGMIAVQAAALEAPIPRNVLKQGSEFTSAANRALQADDFANPGMLWVTRGAGLWREAVGGDKACASCHADAAASMKGVATRYPRIDAGAARLAVANAIRAGSRLRQSRKTCSP